MSLKTRTADTLKWNAIDRVASQVLYAVTGVILARLLTQEEFGLVGAVLVFQAFASLLVDSGFSYALLQRKRPTHTDYSTVLWFNLAVAVALYALLYAAAPWIADLFKGDERLVPLSRVMFLSFIINATSIVQVNRLTKRMDVRMVAISNAIGLAVGAVVGIALAVTDFGAWAIVWQTLTLGAVKSLVLWTTQRWRPRAVFSWSALRSYFGIGSRMMLTSFLNTVFLNIYAFFIGNRTGMVPLGYYTQGDKWSKMGVMSVYQVITTSFLPALSEAQDDPARFRNMCSRMNRFTAYLVFPALVGLAVMAAPIFHVLFGTKWDPAIILFQILLIRGIFTVLCGLYNNYLLALGHSRAIMWLEVLRDVGALVALAITFPYLAQTRPDNPVWGVEILLWGQLAAAALTWAAGLIVVTTRTGLGLGMFARDMAPYLALTCVGATLMGLCLHVTDTAWFQLALQTITGGVFYLGANALAGSVTQREVLAYLRRR